MSFLSKFDRFLEEHRGSQNQSHVLAEMKLRGFTIAETIKAAMQLFAIDLKEAKSLVTSDPSWLPTAQAARPFHQELITLFRQSEQGDSGLVMPEQPTQP